MKSASARLFAHECLLVDLLRSRLSRSWLLVFIILLGFGLRVFHLGSHELRGDEAFGYFFSLRPYDDIVRATLDLREPHPVASYFVQKAWLALTGDSEFALRFVSAWPGALAVALLYRLGRRLDLGAGVAVSGALLLAISPYAVWHSQDARMYTMSLALTLASTCMALEALQRRRRSYWIAYVAVTWLVLQTHYFAFFVIAAQNAFVLPLSLLVWRQPGRLRAWIRAQLALGLFTLPWLILARDTLVGYGGNGDSPAFGPMLVRSFGTFAVGETTPVSQRLVFASLAGLLVAIGTSRLLLAKPYRRQTAVLLLLYLFVPLLATWVSALGRPIFSERYLVTTVPPFYLLVASAFAWYPRRSAPSPEAASRLTTAISDAGDRTERANSLGPTAPALMRTMTAVIVAMLIVVEAGAVLSLGRYYTTSSGGKTVGWRQLATTIDRLSAGLLPEEVRIAQNFPDPTLWYYYRGPVKHIVLPPEALNPESARREVVAVVEAGVRWVILPVQLASWWDDRGIASEVLASEYARVIQTTVAAWPIGVYVRPPDVLGAIEAVFAGELALEAAAVEPSEVSMGGVLVVHLRWQGQPSALPVGEKITIQVLDRNGKVVAQTDQPFSTEAVIDRIASYGILLPEIGLVTGDYRVILALYNPDQPEAPRLQTIQGADHVPLATIHLP